MAPLTRLHLSVPAGQEARRQEEEEEEEEKVASPLPSAELKSRRRRAEMEATWSQTISGALEMFFTCCGLLKRKKSQNVSHRCAILYMLHLNVLSRR